MKTLLLLRHAKSSWKDEALDDRDRPLNQRGKLEATKVGELLKRQQLLPDRIVSSDAKRARRTVERVCDAAGYRGEALLTSELYLAGPPTYWKVLAGLPDDAACVLVVGHNPGLEMLLEGFLGRPEPMTTAALAHVRLAGIEQWADINGSTRGELLDLWQPAEVD